MFNNQISKQMDDEKTITEHEAIIIHYFNTGNLNRKDAIDKYQKFNESHPEYYYTISIVGEATAKLKRLRYTPIQERR